ncbi:hypothetical protein P8935_24100 [Telmatobacter sp. DSM 110680]|uniref:Uncharacterized protein n=1 Tax=Telmatobacter sp. DSM 110680 TaxID=3036704 RepID=A0AAU7DJZ5_9BACT
MPKGLALFLALLCSISPVFGQKATSHPDNNPQVAAAPIQAQPDAISSKWYASSEWWLVVMAAVTAGVICWQSWETRKAAQASKDSIALVLSKERARLAIKVWRSLWFNNPDVIMELLKAPAVQFRATNVGPTHAFNVQLFVSYLLTESEDPEVLPEATALSISNTMKADGKDVYPILKPTLANTLYELGALVGGTKYLQLGGKLTYMDVFGEPRETRFRYIYKKGSGRNEWIEHGVPSENEAT